jgi:2-polyprenyl-6-methoxyphenol hydroxylase-like FAD-dependent oxidoreductase
MLQSAAILTIVFPMMGSRAVAFLRVRLFDNMPEPFRPRLAGSTVNTEHIAQEFVMESSGFDLVTVGGGLGSSALAIAMARKGARDLILEKESLFRDRVRGEWLAPWGVAEARELGIAEHLLITCAKEIPWAEAGFGPRNLVETTPQKLPSVSFSHPEMQEALLAEAEKRGVEVRRSCTVQGIEPAANHSVVVTRNGKDERITARLVVAADGRGSAARKWGGFTIKKNVQPFHFAGVLLTGVATPEDLSTYLFNPEHGLVIGIVPLTKERCRAYLGYPAQSGLRLQGNGGLQSFLAESQKVAPTISDYYAKVACVGPLATFEAGELWVEHPYRDGVALLGDAAATNDPTFGQGLAMTLRDARVLRDALLKHSDWDVAAREYARQHDEYFENSKKVCGWLRTLFQDPSPQSQALRERAMPKIAEDVSRVPDHLFSGPDLPSDEGVRARLFGEC